MNHFERIVGGAGEGVSNDGDAKLAHCLAARTLSDEILDCSVRDGRVAETLFADDKAPVSFL
jgi:hypothetical protein